MRAYHVPDLDGLTEAVVAAPGLGEAAAALGISVRTIRERGWRPAKGVAASSARKAPGQPLYRGIVGTGGRWTSDRAEAAGRAAKAALRTAPE